MNRHAVLLFVPLLALSAGGCRSWGPRAVVDPAPVVFPQPPTMNEIITAVNANSGRVQQLQADVKVSAQGMPGLSGNLALERPRHFRMNAGFLGLQGTGLDIGSNDDLFWVWVKQSVDPAQPAAVYYARHDQFAQSPMRQMIPIEPQWLVESLGVVTLDPAGIHEGPYQRGAGQLEIRSKLPTSQGEMTKVTVVHDRYGWILEQQIYGADNRLLASSRATQHRFFPQYAVSLPEHIDIQVAPGQPTQMAFQIDLSRYHLNQLYGDPAQLWSLPQPKGFPLINLADPRLAAPRSPQYSPPPSRPIQIRPDYPVTGYRPSYRGVTELR